VTPFIFADLVLLALLAVFPAIALWLPRCSHRESRSDPACLSTRPMTSASWFLL